jgi:hypothetical protein
MSTHRAHALRRLAGAADRVARLPGLGRLEVEALLAATATRVCRLPG